jgi:hypothetical protein
MNLVSDVAIVVATWIESLLQADAFKMVDHSDAGGQEYDRHHKRGSQVPDRFPANFKRYWLESRDENCDCETEATAHGD